MYRSANQHYREKYGCKVYKLSIDAGFTCPNRDGKVGFGGCIFCGSDGGSAFAEKGCSIRQQLERAKSLVKAKAGDRFIAYFQSFTNTYAPPEVLRKLYTEAMEPEEILGLAIGTRPDCLGEDVMEVLREVNAIKPVSVELGLQTVHEASVAYIRRGYANPVYFDAVTRLKQAGIEVVPHIILGLPGEAPVMAAETTAAAVAAGSRIPVGKIFLPDSGRIRPWAEDLSGSGAGKRGGPPDHRRRCQAGSGGAGLVR